MELQSLTNSLPNAQLLQSFQSLGISHDCRLLSSPPPGVAGRLLGEVSFGLGVGTEIG
jgi:hypothetical protein